MDVLSPDSTFWNAEARSESFKVRREIIEAFLRMERSTEELELLKSEMKSTMQYWLLRIQTLKQEVRQSTNDTIYSLGATSLLKKSSLDEAEMYHTDAVKCFSTIIEIHRVFHDSNPDNSQFMEDSDISSDSDVGDDCFSS